jgi:hypothetical protein
VPIYPELEIRLFRRDVNSYAADLRFRYPDDPTEQADQDFPVQFNFPKLLELLVNPVQYGNLLGECLLSRPKVRGLFEVARARAGDQALRVRLTIDPSSLKLHRLRWETLYDPQDNRALMRDERLYFSRYLGSFDMRRVELRSRGATRALIAIANPSDLEQYQFNGRSLQPLLVEQELERLQRSLAGMVINTLCTPERVTMDAIRAALREGDHDIFCLVCHGALVNQEPHLLLEDNEGHAVITPGTKLEEALAGLLRLPRLLVLASCQSANDGPTARSDDDGALAALGPRLAAAGVPAVVAMQGNILQPSLTLFLDTFFHELRRDGQIDRAMTVARWALRDQPDYWAPVLFTRLIDGRLWHDRGGGRFEQGWLKQILRGKCVPILGSNLLEPFLGSPVDIARRWAEIYRYPLAPPFSAELPQVAQFLKDKHGATWLRDQYVEDLTAALRERWPNVPDLAPSDKLAEPDQRLVRLLSATWHHLRASTPSEPEVHDVLAQLPFETYVTTNPDNLLVDALKAQGRKPREILCHWRQDDPMREIFDQAAMTVTAGPEQPLVYELFGHFSDTESLILSEDDYFDYLLGVRRPETLRARAALNAALSNNGLLFLGFRLEDWDFRVFCRFLMATEGAQRRKDYKHIAVQLDLDQGRGLPTASAKRCLENYFGGEQKKISIYWGSVEDFIQELNQQWQLTRAEPA